MKLKNITPGHEHSDEDIILDAYYEEEGVRFMITSMYKYPEKVFIMNVADEIYTRPKNLFGIFDEMYPEMDYQYVFDSEEQKPEFTYYEWRLVKQFFRNIKNKKYIMPKWEDIVNKHIIH